MSEKPHFGVQKKETSVTPAPTTQNAETQPVESKPEAGASPSFGAHSEASSAPVTPEASQAEPVTTDAQATSQPTDFIVGAQDNQQALPNANSNAVLMDMLKQKPLTFWAKAVVVSILGYVVSTGQLSIGLNSSFLALFNLILWPFVSVILDELSDQLNLGSSKLTYVLFGTTHQLTSGLGNIAVTAMLLVARFVVFMIEWSMSLVIGAIGYLVLKTKAK